MFLNMW